MLIVPGSLLEGVKGRGAGRSPLPLDAFGLLTLDVGKDFPGAVSGRTFPLPPRRGAASGSPLGVRGCSLRWVAILGPREAKRSKTLPLPPWYTLGGDSCRLAVVNLPSAWWPTARVPKREEPQPDKG